MTLNELIKSAESSKELYISAGINGVPLTPEQAVDYYNAYHENGTLPE